jgi:hypothetical protein
LFPGTAASPFETLQLGIGKSAFAARRKPLTQYTIAFPDDCLSQQFIPESSISLLADLVDRA